MANRLSGRNLNMEKPRIGIVGLGRMGSAIAARLSAQGYAVNGWTRSGIAPARRAELGITTSGSLGELAACSDILILSLIDDAAVDAILTQLAALDLSGKLIVETSTVSPATLRSHAKAIATAGGAALDAPVAGGPGMIATGTVGLYIGGPASDVERFRPVAETLSNRILHVGPLGDGAAAKIVNNMMLVGYWQCLKESLQVGLKAGLSRETMIELLSGSPAASGAFKARIPVLLGESDDVGFTLAGAVKDARLVEATARQYGVDIPAMQASLKSFEAALEKGLGAADLATMVRDATDTV
ncbi:MAG: NAD(P)-dependent oxidoreductase [Allorhizobium sp.]